MRTLSGIEAEESRCTRRCTKGTGGTGRVPACEVVIRLHHLTDCTRDLVAHNKRIEQFAAAGLMLFSQGQYSRQYSDSGMAVQLAIDVVKIQRVRRRTVDQSRSGWGNRFWPADQRADPAFPVL